jgi:hypothetical protein
LAFGAVKFGAVVTEQSLDARVVRIHGRAKGKDREKDEGRLQHGGDRRSGIYSINLSIYLNEINNVCVVGCWLFG